jgi:MFS family permease
MFLNGCTWTVVSTAQTGIGLQLAPSRQHLLATMTTINTAAAALQFVLLPATGALSDAFGRKPVMLARAAASTVFPLLMAARPSYALLKVQRIATILTWHLTESAQQAALADVSAGQEPGRKREEVQGAQLNPWASSYAPPHRLYGVF